MRKEWFRSSPPAAVVQQVGARKQETTRELLKVKDRLIEVERNVSILEGIKFFSCKGSLSI